MDKASILKKKFITNLGFLIFLNGFVKPVYVFGIDRVVQNHVGPEVYGSYFTLFNTAVIFQIFLDLGIENFIRRDIAQYPALVSRYLANVIFLKSLLVIPYAVLCIIIALSMKIRAEEFPLLLVLLLNQFLASFILTMRANLGGLQFFKTEGVISVLDRLIMIFIVGYLLINPRTSGNFRIIWFALTQTSAYVLVLAISFFLVLARTDHFRMHINLVQLIPILRKLMPYALLSLLMAIYYRIDPVLLRIMLTDGDKQAGLFAHAFRILDFMSNYALLFPMLLLPIFSKNLKLHQPVGELLQLASLILIIPSISVIIPTLVYRREIFDLLYHESPVMSGNIYALLTVSYLGMCFSYTFGALLTANGNLRQLNYMAAAAVVVSIILNIILIPRYKVYGAAIANASSQLFTIVYHILLAQRVFRLPVRYRILGRIAIFLILLIPACILFRYFQLNWLLSVSILAGFGLLLSILLKLINIQSLIGIIFREEV